MRGMSPVAGKPTMVWHVILAVLKMAVVVYDGVEPFELGVLCERVGRDRRDSGVPMLARSALPCLVGPWLSTPTCWPAKLLHRRNAWPCGHPRCLRSRRGWASATTVPRRRVAPPWHRSHVTFCMSRTVRSTSAGSAAGLTRVCTFSAKSSEPGSLPRWLAGWWSRRTETADRHSSLTHRSRRPRLTPCSQFLSGSSRSVEDLAARAAVGVHVPHPAAGRDRRDVKAIASTCSVRGVVIDSTDPAT